MYGLIKREENYKFWVGIWDTENNEVEFWQNTCEFCDLHLHRHKVAHWNINHRILLINKTVDFWCPTYYIISNETRTNSHCCNVTILKTIFIYELILLTTAFIFQPHERQLNILVLEKFLFCTLAILWSQYLWCCIVSFIDTILRNIFLLFAISTRVFLKYTFS